MHTASSLQISSTLPLWNLLCLQSFLYHPEYLYSFVLQVVVQEVQLPQADSLITLSPHLKCQYQLAH